MILLSVSVALVLAAYWRFKDVPLDRDYAPYAYHTMDWLPHGGWLRDGHADIKTPGIQALYSLAASCFKMVSSITKSGSWGSPAHLRAVPFAGLALSVMLLAWSNPGAALPAALLLASPSLWGFMANTEWLAVLLTSSAYAAASVSAGPLAPFFLGCLPWANQKNALLLPVLLLVPELREPFWIDPWLSLASFALPSVLFMAWIAATGRLKQFWIMCYLVPKSFGGRRTFRNNTLMHLHLLKPIIIFFAVFMAFVDWTNPWAWVFVGTMAVHLSSKQFMPHHAIQAAFPLALAVEWTWGMMLAFGIIWFFRDFPVWKWPKNIYKVVFGGAGGQSYGDLLEDSEQAAKWVVENTDPKDIVWCNSHDNNIYLLAKRQAWCFVLPEMRFEPETERDLPKVIVHGLGHLEFDYDKYGYKLQGVTMRGFYSLLKREAK